MSANVKTGKKRRVKYPGLRNIAGEMGITFSHLWKILEGHRTDPRGHAATFWRISRERHPEKHAG